MRRSTVAALVMLLAVSAILAAHATTARAAPGPISGLTSPTYATASLSFSWSPVGGVAGYAYTFDRSPNTLGGSSVALSALSFSASQIEAGAAPWQAVSGDFGNGTLDLAVVNLNSSTVSVLLGNGHGTFIAGNTYDTGTTPHGIAVGDFNGDGRPDLAVADWGANTVSVLLGNGTGTFAAKVDYPTGASPHGIAVGDLGNGRLDLVVANAYNNTVSVLLGNGDGTFQPKVDYTVGAHPEKIAVGDFNGDRNPDLAVINNVGDTVSILLGRGDGSFIAGNSHATGTTPHWVAAGDFGNGELDLAVANWADNTVSVLLGHGDGTFAPKVDYAVGGNPAAVEIADINGDGLPDLVVSDNVGSVAVLLGKGDGSFLPAQFTATSPHVRFFAMGDFDGDDLPDLALPLDTGTSVAILLNTTASHSLSVRESASAEGVWYFHVCAVDVAGDPGPTSTRQVKIDGTPPTTAADAPSGWQNHAVTVTLSATDAVSGMVGGQAGTWYKIDGGSSTAGTTAVVTGDGSHTLSYYSKDAAGNVETQQVIPVMVDTLGARTIALSKARVKKSGVVTFRFRVNDVTPQAHVTIEILRKGHVRKRLAVGRRATGTVLIFRWRCSLAKGSYRWVVEAVDLAGNRQIKAGSNSLIVT